MQQQLIHPLLVHSQRPLLLLKVLSFALPLLRCLLDHVLDIIWVEAVEDFPEEIPLRKSLFIISCRVRQMVCNVGEEDGLVIDMLDGQLRPVWDGSRRDALGVQDLLLASEDGLDEG